MINGKAVIAVIPARGGSKGLPNKNILDLEGKPIIAYTIEAALKSRYVDRVIVSTDSPEIAGVARQFGAEVPFMRPAELATDTAHTPPVIEHAVSFLEAEGFSPDFVLTLQPTSPLRKAGHIDQCVELMAKGYHSAVTVKPSEYPPYWMVTMEGNKAVPFVNDGTDYTLLERQELRKTYQINGAVYVTKRNILKQKGVIIDFKNCGVCEMEHKESLDIDTAEDWERIRLVLKRRKGEMPV